MIDPNKQYRTRDGREVRIYAVDGDGDFSVHGAVCQYGKWLVETWTSEGRVYRDGEDNGDLIELKPRIKRTVWLNVYPDTTDLFARETKDKADKAAGRGRIACIPIEIDCEEGEGL